jgi:predicted nucleotidyltransferase component of viral defense system
MRDWQIAHGKVIDAFLEYLNDKSNDFVLKGGTALLSCYNLDRFSEDIDLDGKSRNIEEIVNTFCKKSGYAYRIAKDTDTVKRYMINYGDNGRPLKIEVSYRRREIDAEEITKINGILVYNLNDLTVMKTNAYTSRDKIRDLYDVTFICNHYFDQLNPQTISLLRSAIEYKGIEQFDYIVKEQHDELIDEKKLAGDFLSMYDKLGLLYDRQEKQIIDSIEDSAADPPQNGNIRHLTSKEERKSLNSALSMLDRIKERGEEHQKVNPQQQKVTEQKTNREEER